MTYGYVQMIATQFCLFFPKGRFGNATYGVTNTLLFTD